ncbi:hypothetical protein [Leucobacter aridicollis]|uniref:hypothetical protein n=1 Tax=Leucobacter aridicollis TaxID=283878 RepID=UPI002168D1E0|nr:hypothetical protein [Leucobacter aridicollis]MCS3427969.1 ABC-2 type transport system permease protein [Leucobacter aridicollis]
MVARLFRLRVALAGGLFRGSVVRAARVALLLVLCLGVAAVSPFAISWFTEPGGIRNVLDVTIGAVVLALALLVPLFDSRRNLVPRQFGQFPAKSGSVALSMLVTTIVSWPFLVMLVWLVALWFARPEWHAAGWIGPVALVLAALLAIVAVRFGSGLSQLAIGDRYAGGLRLTGGILCIAVLPLLVFVVAESLRSDTNQVLVDAAGVLGWTPFGAAFAAIGDAIAGDDSTATLRLGVLAGTTIVLAIAWFGIAAKSLTSIERPRDILSARRGLGWFERFPAKPAPVIAARQLTYWQRDPRYRIALIALPIAPIAVVAAFLIAGADVALAAALPLPIFMLLLGWSQHNDIAMDSTAIWEHVASGIRGWADRAGRLAPALMFGVPVAVIGSSLTVTFMGDWRVLPAVIGMNVGVLLIATGVASVFSALMPYPATRPGDSPFVQPQWSGSGSGTSQTVSMVVALVLSVAPVWISAAAIADPSFMGNIFALLFGVGFGLIVLLAGVAIGGRIFDKQGPEILAVTQIFD